MSTYSRLTSVYKKSPEITFDNNSKIVFMSDCHRGDTSWADDYARNQNICYHALTQYYKKGFTYIELGDGDELWKNRNFSQIVTAHSNVFELLSKFYSSNRLHLIFGNHDIIKKRSSFVNHNMQYGTNSRGDEMNLFPNIKVHEGLILKHVTKEYKFFIVHGHQGDIFNDTLWQFTRFLVRYVWRPLEVFGINDPTDIAQNYQRKLKTEKRLTNWVKQNVPIIAGHTHRPMFPKPTEPLYFNDGSCVHPRCITAIEISNSQIALVKWFINTRADGNMFIDRQPIVDAVNIDEYFTNLTD